MGNKILFILMITILLAAVIFTSLSDYYDSKLRKKSAEISNQSIKQKNFEFTFNNIFDNISSQLIDAIKQGSIFYEEKNLNITNSHSNLQKKIKIKLHSYGNDDEIKNVSIDYMRF